MQTKPRLASLWLGLLQSTKQWKQSSLCSVLVPVGIPQFKSARDGLAHQPQVLIREKFGRNIKDTCLVACFLFDINCVCFV